MNETTTHDLDERARQAADVADRARQQLQARQAADADERAERERAWAAQQVADFDAAALRDDVRAAHRRVHEALHADPLGRSLLDYVTAILRERHRIVETRALAGAYGLDPHGIPAESETFGTPWRDGGGAHLQDLTAATTMILPKLLLSIAEADVADEQTRTAQARDLHTSNHGTLEPPEPLTPQEQGLADRQAAHDAYMAELAANGVDALAVPAEGLTERQRAAAGLPSGSSRQSGEDLTP